MGVRLNEKDLAVLKDTARFRGLSAESMRQVHFGGSTYAWKRLGALYEDGYLGRKYYYDLHRTPGGAKHSQRIAAIYYPTPRGLKAIDYQIDPRYVVPNDDKLDIHYMLGKLYTSMPDLLSKREAQRLGLKSFMPVTCVHPARLPVFISIIGKNKSPWEDSRLINFFKSGIFPGTYIAVSRDFPGEKLLLTDSHFIPWDLAPEIVPKMIGNKNYYLDEFINKFKGAEVLGRRGPFIEVRFPERGTFYLGELLTGSTRLMLSLRSPPERAYIFIESVKHLSGVKLERGSFLAYARKDKKLYRFFTEGGRMKHHPVGK